MTGARGEAVINSDGREITVFYTNRTLAEIESLTKKSILEIANGLVDGSTGITEVAQILRAGIKAADQRQVSIGEAYKIMDRVGFSVVAAAVMTAVSDVLGYTGESDEDIDSDEDLNPNA